ncbi:putative ABC transport system ATP-binding protein [Actinocorallia herbida]|uniref:Putative ABC transport system ATP-binding protein n=2 Tax=Actinocorallia herbida TaxID=58109 RepID=A0A3N1D200_9ACTN|nr:putative ABC transport system ATP-binding protein [Actinocorallia herbida]
MKDTSSPMTERPADDAVVRCTGLARTFGSGRAATVALHRVSCTVPPGARIALSGPSGSGKSTLLHLLAGLDEPTAGEISWSGLGGPPHGRPGTVGLVFQGPSLLPDLDVRENVALPLILGGTPEQTALRAAGDVLRRLQAADLAAKLPEELSGGQAQRAAVARVLAGRPALILADEPTGQLDHQTGDRVITVLLNAADELGAALVISTHDPAVLDRFTERWTMRDGTLIAAPGPGKGAPS